MKEYLHIVRYVLISLAIGVIIGFLFEKAHYYRYSNGILIEVGRKDEYKLIKNEFNYKYAFMFSAISIAMFTIYSNEKYRNIIHKYLPYLEKVKGKFVNVSLTFYNDLSLYASENIETIKGVTFTSFMSSIKKTIKYMFKSVFKPEIGRIGRLRYLGVILGTNILLGGFESVFMKAIEYSGNISALLICIYITIGLILIYSQLRAVVARLHDLNYSGKTIIYGFLSVLLIWGLLFMLMEFTEGEYDFSRLNALMGVVLLGLFFILNIFLIFVKGNVGNNKYSIN